MTSSNDLSFTVYMASVGERGSAELHIDTAKTPQEAYSVAKDEIEKEYIGTEWRLVAVLEGVQRAAILGEDA